jgi:hypothetical protein
MKKVRYNDRIWFGKYKGVRVCELLKNDIMFLNKLEVSGVVEFDEKIKYSMKDRSKRKISSYFIINSSINTRHNEIGNIEHINDMHNEIITELTAEQDPVYPNLEPPTLEQNDLIFAPLELNDVDIMFSMDFYYTGNLTEFFRRIINESFMKIFTAREYRLATTLRDIMLKKIIENISLENHRCYNVKFHRRNEIRGPEDICCKLKMIDVINDYHFDCNCMV